MASIANGRLASASKKGKTPKIQKLAPPKQKAVSDESEDEEESGNEESGDEERSEEESGGEDIDSTVLQRTLAAIESEKSRLQSAEALLENTLQKRKRAEDSAVGLTAGKMVRIKNGGPVAVTEDDIEEYGCLESAVHGIRVENDPVSKHDPVSKCVELHCTPATNCVRLWTGPSAYFRRPDDCAGPPNLPCSVADLKVWGSIQEGRFPGSSARHDHRPYRARQHRWHGKGN